MRSLVTAFVVAVGLAACGGPAAPDPDVSNAEPAVRQRIREARAAVVAAPGAATWGRYARVLHAHAKFAAAEVAYLAAADFGGPQEFANLHFAGIAASEDLQPERATDHFRRAIARRGDHAATHLHLALLEERLDHVDAARSGYERALALAPSSHALLGLGRLALRSGDANAALQRLTEALRVNPEHREVHEAMARAYARLGRNEDSARSAQRAGDAVAATPIADPLLAEVTAEDVSFSGLLAKADALLRAQRYEEGLQVTDLALQARPAAPDALYYRGYFCASLGRAQDAIAAYRALLQARPQDADARANLASILKQTGDVAAARREADAVLAAQPEQKVALQVRAMMLLEQNQRAQAENDLRTLLRVDPGNQWARSQMGR